jgi:hypothetical protein
MRRLLLAALSLATLACSDATTSAGAGRTRVYLTDSPFPYGSIAQVNVYIARIEASTTPDTSNLEPPNWVTIATPERTFNLLDFQGGAATLLGEVDLPANQYAAVRVVINTGRSSVVRNDGSSAPVHWPISGELSLFAFVPRPLAISDAGARIVLDFDVGLTFLDDGGGGFYFAPTIRAVIEEETGGIGGVVTGTSIEGDAMPAANVAVTVFAMPADTLGQSLQYAARIGTGRTDAQGHYLVAFLPAGRYAVLAEEPAFPKLRAVSWGTQVSVGRTTTANLALALDTTTTGGGTDTTGVDTTGAPTGPVARLTITPVSQTISVGDSAGAVAASYNAQNLMLTGPAVTWSLSDSTVVSVTQAAYNWILLRGERSGTTTLTATSEGVSATATVTVR